MRKAFLNIGGCMLGMYLAATQLPGVNYSNIATVLTAGAVLGVLYLLVRPLMKLVAAPLALITFGLAYLALDAVLLMYVTRRYPALYIQDFLWAALAALVVNLCRWVVGWFIPK